MTYPRPALRQRNAPSLRGRLPQLPALAQVDGMTTWTIDPLHSSITFSIRHLLITTVHGSFHGLTGKLDYEPGRLESASIEVDIAAASLDTHQAQRDEHLRSPDFFDVASHPTIHFRSKRMTSAAVIGDLSLRGVTREVALELVELTDAQKDHRGSTRIGASASTRLKRSDFGMTYNRALETGGVALADEVKVTIDLSLIQDG
jgi:polyisoprenoid-binding protein YceI